MRFLLISLLTVLLCTSCALKTTEGLRETALVKEVLVNPYFSQSSVDYVYKAKIDVYGKYFGGILIVKKTAADAHRVVFTTEFGSKIFDFLYEGDTFTKNFVLPDLDKKIIVNTLRDDFKLLISENIPVVKQFVSEDHKVYKSEMLGRYNFYFFDASEENLEKLVHTSKYKEKVTITFEPQEGKPEDSEEKLIAEKITIKHSNINVKIDLEYLKQS
jgi:hypothetical protein